MTNYHQFHDGFLVGFCIHGANVRVHLADVEGVRFDAVATEVAALTAGGFRSGNIILEVLVLERSEVTKQQIGELYDLLPGAAGESQSEQLMLQVHDKNLVLLEVNPSYGGHCLILARSIEIRRL